MYKKKLSIVLLLALVSFSIKVSAQEEKKDAEDTADATPKPKFSYFKPKITFLSNSVYSGRKDSATLSYLSPSISYNHKSGISIGASTSYLVNGGTNRFDAISFDIGYDFDIMENWSAGISGSKDFYNDSSQVFQSSTSWSLNADMSYDFDFIEVGTTGEVMFGESTQYGAGFSLARGFKFGKEDTACWTISPTAKAGFGTQDFFHQHTRKAVKKRNQNANIKNGIVTDIVSGSNSFSVLDYEISVPVSFDAVNWGVSFIPNYAMPVNPVTTKTKTTIYQNGVLLPQSQQPKPEFDREDLSNSFYFEIAAYWKFAAKKKTKK